MGSAYDASAIRATLSHVNGDLFNVNVYFVQRRRPPWPSGSDR